MKKFNAVIIAVKISTGGSRKDASVLQNGLAFEARSQSSQVAVKKSKIVLIIPCGKNVEKSAK